MAGSSRLVAQMSNCSEALLTQKRCRRPDADHRQMPGTTSFGLSGRLFGDSVGLASWSAGGAIRRTRRFAFRRSDVVRVSIAVRLMGAGADQRLVSRIA